MHYLGVALYTRHSPSDVRAGFAHPEFGRQRAAWSCALTPHAQAGSIIIAFSQRLVDERQQAKYRFLTRCTTPARPGSAAPTHSVRRCQHRAPEQPTSKKLARGNLKNSGFLPEERAWLQPAAVPRRLVDDVSGAAPRRHRRRLHLVESNRAKPTPTTWAGASTTTWPRRWLRLRVKRRNSRRKILRPRAFDHQLRLCFVRNDASHTQRRASQAACSPWALYWAPCAILVAGTCARAAGGCGRGAAPDVARQRLAAHASALCALVRAGGAGHGRTGFGLAFGGRGGAVVPAGWRNLWQHLALYSEPAHLLGLAGQVVFALLPWVPKLQKNRPALPCCATKPSPSPPLSKTAPSCGTTKTCKPP